MSFFSLCKKKDIATKLSKKNDLSLNCFGVNKQSISIICENGPMPQKNNKYLRDNK